MLTPLFEFSAAETAACKRLIDLALDEDLGSDDAGGRVGDATSQAVIPADLPGRAVFIARADSVLIKDNHLAALRIADCGLRIREAVERARQASPALTVEIEVQTLEEFDVALACRPDMILLDNMTLGNMREAVRRRNAQTTDVDYVALEASGGVNLQTVRAIAETGVDRISVGALTHSPPALDIALDYESGDNA